MKRKIAIVGAFDRFNYGDILFPHIIKNALAEINTDLEIDYYSISKSDLCKYGGKVTKSLSTLFNEGEMKDEDIVIIAGGCTMGTSWSEMYRHYDNKLYSFQDYLKYFVPKKTINKIFRIMSGTTLSWPWIITPSDFNKNINVVYNSVGGNALNYLSRQEYYNLSENLKRVNYISVRDNDTYRLLESVGGNKNIKLSPDSAILLSKYYPKDQLSKNSNYKEIIGGDYLCFQVNKNIGLKYSYCIAQQLVKIYKESKLKIVMVGLGRAKAHEDEIAIMKIINEMDVPVIKIENTATIFEIATIIANAKIFVGSSLHGNITACAYGVPFIGLSYEVSKLNSFFNTWINNRLLSPISISLLEYRVRELLKLDVKHIVQIRDMLKNKAEDNFKHMFETINI